MPKQGYSLNSLILLIDEESVRCVSWKPLINNRECIISNKLRKIVSKFITQIIGRYIHVFYLLRNVIKAKNKLLQYKK